VAGAEAGFHANQARRQGRHQFSQQDGTLGRSSTGLPVASTPCTAKAFFARSIPSITIVMISPLGQIEGKFALPIVALS